MEMSPIIFMTISNHLKQKLNVIGKLLALIYGRMVCIFVQWVNYMQQRQMKRMHKYLIHFLTQIQQEFMLLYGDLIFQIHNHLVVGFSWYQWKVHQIQLLYQVNVLSIWVLQQYQMLLGTFNLLFPIQFILILKWL